MRIVKDAVEYQGTPSELADFFRYTDNTEPRDKGDSPSFATEDFIPLEDVVKESETLREKLAKNPAYNPHTGVVPSKEPTTPDITAPSGQLFTSDEDTGVKISG